MSRLINETGNRYGRLLVIGPGEVRRTTKMWRCLCDCGNDHIATGANLRSGCIGSCGRCGYKRLPDDEAACRQALNNYRRNAINRGIEFALSIDDFRKITKQACIYCGAPPSNKHNPARPRDGATPYIYSGIDRIDNSRGYVEMNIVACCAVCNRAKSDMTIGKFLQWAARLSATIVNLNYKG